MQCKQNCIEWFWRDRLTSQCTRRAVPLVLVTIVFLISRLPTQMATVRIHYLNANTLPPPNHKFKHNQVSSANIDNFVRRALCRRRKGTPRCTMQPWAAVLNQWSCLLRKKQTLICKMRLAAHWAARSDWRGSWLPDFIIHTRIKSSNWLINRTLLPLLYFYICKTRTYSLFDKGCIAKDE